MMRVMIISLRNVILGGLVFLIVLVAGVVLLVKDPLDVGSSYKPNEQSVLTSSEANKPFSSEKPSINLDVKVDGSTAEVNLNPQHFRFVKESADPKATPVFGEGHAHLYLDGKSLGMVYSPEFLLKKLPKGEHELRVELTYSNHLPYKVEAVRVIEVK
ncbi:hypothetical protein [Brevibacillus sp. H7]|uniref:hypothetical protein n=1 Tax=Brevibacillus sp. H7 TaxID=3349138 RepID=UPI0038283F2D